MKKLQLIPIGLFMALSFLAKGQVTKLDNTITLPNQFIGCDVNSTQPLRYTTMLNYRHEWRTNNAQRMILNESLTNQTVNGYTGLDLSGFLGVGAFNVGPIFNPLAKIHINEGGWREDGLRPWMRQGTLITDSTDHGYFGLKYEGNRINHTVIAWSDNDVWDPGADQMKFIFTGALNQNGAAGTLNGLEAARFLPDATGDLCYFGLGDWANSGGQLPDERLDILDRTIRLRSFMASSPVSWENPAANRILAADPTTGRVWWRDVSSISSDKDWFRTANDDVVTGWPNSNGFPENGDKVGIGMDSPKTKLHVLEVKPSGGVTAGIRSDIITDDVQNIGVQALAIGSHLNSNIGFTSLATDGKLNTGGHFAAVGGKQPVGAIGFADGEGQATPIGVWGIAVNQGPTGGPGWAGWFDGRTWCTLGIWSGSDAMLKENVEDLQNASSILADVMPKTYTYNVQDYGYLGLEDGNQMGVIAQELESVLPDLVADITRPEILDSLGNITEPETTFKGVKYEGFIPLLIQGHKEQQARIDQLEAMLMDCCNSMDHRMEGGQEGGTEGMEKRLDELLQIAPNPFKERTVISYHIEQDGRLNLQVANSQGVIISVLEEGQRKAGQYQYQWNTGHLAPGTYFVTLLMNDKPLVERAVKLK